MAYMVLIMVVAAALVVMRNYLNRSVQENYRKSMDAWGQGEQYEAGRSSKQYGGSTWENKKLECPQVQAKLRALNKQVSDIYAKIKKLTDEIKEYSDRIDELRDRINDVEKQAQELEARGFYDEAQRLRKAIIPDLEDQIKKLQAEIQKRVTKINALNFSLRDLLDMIADIQSRYPQC